MADITAAESQECKDIQGIPWEMLGITKDKYKENRLKQYKNYESVPLSGESSGKECKATKKREMYYEFRYNSRSVRPTIIHFQYLDRPGISFCARTSYEDNAITNAIEIYTTLSGALHFTACNNDCGVGDFDMERFQLTNHFRYPWPVNYTSMSPDGKYLVIVGDNPDALLVDANSGKTIETLAGHLDFSFASAWHPNGYTFVTGNQDKTCRIWDAQTCLSLAVLKGNLGAIRSIRYTSDGQFMAMAEPADFVHVYDVKGGYEKEQEIDFFGEISGMSFSPDTEALFVGCVGPFI